MSGYRDDRDEADRYRRRERDEYPSERGDYDRQEANYRDRDDDGPVMRDRVRGGGREYGRDYDERSAPYGGAAGYGYHERFPGGDYGPDVPGRGYGRDDHQRARNDEGWRSFDEGDSYPPRRYGGFEGHRGRSRSRVRCRDIMTRDVTTATRDTTLHEVARLMHDDDTGVIPVVDHTEEAPAATARHEGARTRTYSNGKLVGLITDRDIVMRAIAEGKDPKTTRAEEVMTTDIHTARPNDRVIDTIRKMGDKQVRRVPVVDLSGNLRGIISMADVALETEEDHELASALEEISSGASFWGKIFG